MYVRHMYIFYYFFAWRIKIYKKYKKFEFEYEVTVFQRVS